MYKAISNHQIKILAAATVLVLVWFVHLYDLPIDTHIPGLPKPRPAAPPKTTYGTGSVSGTPPTVLRPEDAGPFCSHFRLPPFPADRVKSRKVYDLLLINTEVELLELRLGQMSPYVDYFVILESDRTFSDKPKPLYIKENWERFAPYHSQMIRRTMDLTNGDFKSAWNREAASRNAMFSQVVPFLTGEQEAHEDDVLLVSDVDEIFKPSTIRVLRNCATPLRVTAVSKLMYYGFQWMAGPDWNHPQATVYRGEGGNETALPDDLRHKANDYKFVDGAWHCSYCFSTIEELVGKISSFSHTELDLPKFKDPKTLLARVRNGVDPFDRTNCTRIEDNTDIPDFLLANPKKYDYMLNRDPTNANFKDVDPSGNVQDIDNT